MFRVWGSGVSGLEFGVWGAGQTPGIGVWGLVFEFWGLGFGVRGNPGVDEEVPNWARARLQVLIPNP